MIEAKLPLLGDAFPKIEVKTTHGVMNLPDDYSGKWLVLFSHPGDFTPVCTTEFVAFAQKYHKFKELNTELLGLSVDQVYAHLKWVEWINENADVKIPFPIIADELGRVSQTLGMVNPETWTSTVRAVFIIDPKGILRLMMYYPQEVGRSVDEILRALKALQITDKFHIAAPENYPNNDWLGSDVIVPAAATEEKKEERLKAVERGELKSKDWWLCHKSL